MGMSLHAVDNSGIYLSINYWIWRPLMNLFRTSGVQPNMTSSESTSDSNDQIDDDPWGLFESGIGYISPRDTQSLYSHIENFVKTIPAGHIRVLLDLETTEKPDDAVFHRSDEDMHLNYSIPVDFFPRILDFLRKCPNGFLSGM
jgi:hypothetical protein